MCFFLAVIGIAVLATASALWEFWAASALLSAFSYTGTGLGSALITDLVERASLGRGLSLFTATIWVGGVVGLAETGLSLRSLGIGTTFSLGAGIMLVAAVLVFSVRNH